MFRSTARATRGHPFRRPASPRAARVGTVLSLVLAVTGSAGLVWQASYAAYSAQTTSPGNNWATGSVTLSDDDANAAMFSETGLKPGSTGSTCIRVTSTGTLPATVRLYGTGATRTNALDGYIDLVVDQGSGGSFGSCSGFASAGTIYTGTLAAFPSTFGTGVGTWVPTGSGTDSRTFRIQWTVNTGAPDSTQDGSAAIAFTWEAQSA
jgi:hypothetical protein